MKCVLVKATIASSETLTSSLADVKNVQLNYVYEPQGDIGILYVTEPPVHQWIAFQAYNKLESGLLKTEIALYLPTSSSSSYYSSTFDAPSGWKLNDNAWYEVNKALIEGVCEEDAYGVIGWRSRNHFWNPDGEYDEGLIWEPITDSALETAQVRFSQAVSSYNSGNKTDAYYWLGRTAHLLMDMSVPAHVQLDWHIPLVDGDDYEEFTGAGENYKVITSASSNTTIPDYTTLPSYPRYTPGSYDDFITNIFYNLSNDADRFDSDDYDGDSSVYGQGKYRTASNDLDPSKTLSLAFKVDLFGSHIRQLNSPADYSAVNCSWVGESSIVYSWAFYQEINLTTNGVKVYYTDGTSETFYLFDTESNVPYAVCGEIYQPYLQARAIGYVAALYQLFWNETHPTVNVTIAAYPSDKNLKIKVDGTEYTNSVAFAWTPGSSHTIEAPSPQTGSDSKQYSFVNWSDSGAQTHTINPSADTTITAVYSTGEQTSITASADTSVSEANPTTNYHPDPLPVVGTLGARWYTLVKFDLSSIPAGSTIDSVELQMPVFGYFSASITLSKILQSWTETGVSWNTKPSYDTDYIAYTNFGDIPTWVWSSSNYPKLKTVVQGWFNSPSTNYGFHFRVDPGQDGIYFYARHRTDPAQRPKLVVNYTPPPPDVTPPTPNPMTWSTEPYETSTTSISMTATAASDSSTPIYYQFDFYGSPTGGSGGDDSGWQTSRTYTDLGLQANHQYGYRVRARDSAAAQNTTTYSSVSYDYTDIETPSDITFGTVTSTSIEAKSTNTPSGLDRGNSVLFICHTDSSGWICYWLHDNNLRVYDSLSPNTQYGFWANARNGDGEDTAQCARRNIYTLARTPVAGSFYNVTASSIEMSWDSNGNPANTYYLCENTTTGANSGWTTSLSWTSTGLSWPGTYSFRVKARNGDGVETEWTDLGSQITHHEPEVVAIIPDSGPNGTVMTIQGQYFYDSGSVVFTGGASAEILDWNDTVIHCRVPQGARTGNVIVQTYVSSNPKYFTITDPNIIYVESNSASYVDNGTETYPFGRIQWGIDAATNSDTVIVRPGRYYENINFKGKNITLTSLDPEDSNIVETTIVDGNSNSSVVTFNSGEDANCKLIGFTITGAGYGDWPDWYGVGINCYQSNPKISHCNITENTPGGGGYFEESDAIIENCFITQNSGWCGGISCFHSNISISNCDIRMNTSTGGIWLCNGHLWMTECNITGNTGYLGGGISCTTDDEEGSGSTSLSVRDCNISGNLAYGYDGEIGCGKGGGIYCGGPVDVNIVSCMIARTHPKTLRRRMTIQPS
jgi:hypothetical protein